jgi:hypothetical protein
MDIINKILLEWRYQLPAGYPQTDSDYHKLGEVLSEMTDLDAASIQRIVERARTGNIITEQEDVDTTIDDKIASIGLPSDLNTQIITIYNQLSESDKQNFNKNFRTHTIESFVNSGWKAFEKFFLVNVGGARGGMGNGEVSILLGVRDSKPGGTAQHDIVMSNGEWEVKELKSGKFDPAREGLASKFALTAKIEDFYKNIVVPLNEIGDPYQSLKHMVDPSSAEALKKLLMIFETRFSEAIDADKLASYEWKKSAFHNWYEGFKELHTIFYKTKLDTDVKDTRMTVNADGQKQSYWISDDDAEEIQLAAGEDDTADIYVGEPVNNENTNAVIWFKRIERNEFVRNPKQFVFELDTIKNEFFTNILGLVWYNYRNPQPHIGLPNNFVIDNLSQGRYRFVLREAPASQGYPYLQEQG